MPGSKPASRHTSEDYTAQMGPVAWVATEPAALDYTSSLNFLKIGMKVVTPPHFPLVPEADHV
jgi:hypothetical protein